MCRNNKRSDDSVKRRIRADILNEADVICTTLSGAGHESTEQLDFDMIIVDEAAQAIELSSLIPLKFRSRRCVMVGGKPLMPCKYLHSCFVRSTTVGSHSTIPIGLFYLATYQLLVDFSCRPASTDTINRSSFVCKSRDLMLFIF